MTTEEMTSRRGEHRFKGDDYRAVLVESGFPAPDASQKMF
jgi:hypothetical protein